MHVTRPLAASIGAGVLAIIFGLSYKWFKQSSAEERPKIAASTSPSAIDHHNVAPTQSVVPPHVLVKARSNYVNLFRESHNYLDFARATIGAARGGDSDAQYYLGRALGVCDDSRPTFHFNSQEIGLDEALSRYSFGQNSARRIEAVYERCHDLEAVGNQAKLFGNPGDWIKSAADQGNPAAESDEALKGFAAIQSSAMGLPRADDLNALTKSDVDSRSLLLAAVQTKDPEALFNVGLAQGYLNNFNSDTTKNELAWWLVACQRGLPCDGNSEFQLDVSLNDGLSGLSGPELICAMAGKDCQDAERRAREINEKLDAGAWSQLGLW